MEEKLVSKIDNEIPDCWPSIEDTERLILVLQNEVSTERLVEFHNGEPD